VAAVSFDCPLLPVDELLLLPILEQFEKITVKIAK
jgi:hypothetical protein